MTTMTTPKHTELPESQLLACPFCGKQVTYACEPRNGIRIAFVFCNFCGARGCESESDDLHGTDVRRFLIKHWNTRSSDHQHAELIRQRDELAKTCRDMRKQLMDIRWSEWPIIGCGIGLTPKRIDELIKQADQALTPTKET